MSDPLAGLYQELILDHSKRPIGKHELTDFDAEQFMRNPTCGDEVTVRVRFEGDTLAEIAWTGQGCSISQASASVLSSLATGHTRAELTERIEAFRTVMRSRGQEEGDEELLEDAVAFAGVSKFPMRVKCAMLSWTALEGTLAKLS